MDLAHVLSLQSTETDGWHTQVALTQQFQIEQQSRSGMRRLTSYPKTSLDSRCILNFTTLNRDHVRRAIRDERRPE